MLLFDCVLERRVTHAAIVSRHLAAGPDGSGPYADRIVNGPLQGPVHVDALERT
jgi:hypothetical protein